ncbi:ABC transporter substrate-binding protein [Paenibacillus turicensis]|uniref:ABC transporter substrate-binding protein n=1 Tax=Paenibacillus turicensis TaxID=160487 RepID=UPI003D2CCDDE
MKKKLNLSMLLLLMMVVIISACGNNATKNNQSAGETKSSVSEEKSKDTVTYQSENGPVKVPAQPTRIVALSNGPNVLSLNGTVVGVDQWTAGSPLFSDKLKDVAIVTADDPEGVAAQNPDLIIVGAESKNIDQLQKIAPTVVYTWGKLNYLDQQVEIGKLLNKEAEAKQWVEDFSKKAAEVGNKIKAKYGEKMTVSVIELSGKDVYVMGDHWARGTEILFQAMKLNMPEKAKEETMKQGYNTLSLEVLPQYVGDFVVVSRDVATDNEIMKSTIWSKIPAVQNKHVIEIDTKASSYSDPTTLEHLLNIFEKGFLGSAE